MRKLTGALCCVTFILTIAGYMVGYGPNIQAEVFEIDTTDIEAVEVNRSEGEEEEAKEKSTTLEIVWMEGCSPCRRIKIVALVLIAEGYDVILTPKDQDDRGSSKFPSLYYLDDEGNVNRKEVGFKTTDHIKKYLTK